jgi:hypothetical protein
VGGKVDLNIDIDDDLIKVEENWDSAQRETEYIVRFLGVEVARYQNGPDGWPPKGYRSHELAERGERMARALWALGDPGEN